MFKNNLIVILLLVTVLVAIPTVQAQSVFAPAEDRVTDLVLELQARGHLRDLSAIERPWLISDIKNGIENDKEQFDNDSENIANLILKIIAPAQTVEDKNLSANINFGVKLRGLSRENRDGYFYLRDRFIDRGFKGEFGGLFNSDLAISQDNKWGMAARLVFDSDGKYYPWYYGRAITPESSGNLIMPTVFTNQNIMISFSGDSVSIGVRRHVEV